MYQIDNISNDALQTTRFALPDGGIVTLVLYFMPMQYCWLIRKLTYGDFTLSGIRIVNSGNLLHQWRNIIPFGLACFSKNNREPSLQEDFSSGASNLYLLTEDEVEEFTGILLGEVSS